MILRLFRVVGNPLEEAVAVDDLPSIMGFSDYTAATGVVGEGVVQSVEDGGHYIQLLHDTVAHEVGIVAGVENNHRDVVPSVIVVVFAVESLPWVVCGDDEDGVVVPGGLFGAVKELSKCIVGVAYAF